MKNYIVLLLSAIFSLSNLYAQDNQEKRHGKENADYITTLSNLASYNSKLGNYSEAIRLGTEALSICERLFGKKHSSYAIYLNNLASYNADLGNYKEAIQLSTEALNIQEELFGRKHRSYATFLANLALYNSKLSNYNEAIRLATEALNIQEELIGKEHPSYAASLNNLAFYNSNLGKYSEAIRLATEALSIQEKLLGKGHPLYATFLDNLAFYNNNLGNYNEAIRLTAEALSIHEKLLGKEHPSYTTSLRNLSTYYYYANNPQLLAQYASDATKLSKQQLCTTFSSLTSSERNLFWKKYEPWFLGSNLEFAYKFPTESLITNAYNGTLLSKGLLLNSEIEMTKLLLESGDKEMVSLYGELQKNRQALNKLYEKPITERFMNTDSLENVVNRIERDLVQRSKAYGDYTRNLAIGWEDVQKKLSEKDIAVEFVSFPHTKDSIMYVAFVLKPDMEAPQMVSLFEAKELAPIYNYKYYTTPEISKLVWGKLENYLDDCDNVYFAPAGILYNIAIESLPDYNGEGVISDRFNFYRLSSTRELAVTKDKNAIKEATLYGGLKYDTDTQQMAADSKRYQKRGMPDFELFNIADSLNLRGGANYLPATKVEAENINNSLTKTSIHSSLFTDTLGTEASFKNLSGKKTNLLHIATHGFYWNEQEAQQNGNMSFLMLGDGRSPSYVEDKALTRSGLLFSGANNALTGMALPENVEDGILTAKEISALDLRGLDLVVLSACQTGLGEITGDGVFGLQRGFKKAGANTLMMSLWKVDDNATQLLMSQFYENLIAGKNKYESLRDAQRYVREYEPGEDTEVNTNRRSTSARRRQEAQNRQSQKTDKRERPYQSPEYWAAFILLDAVD